MSEAPVLREDIADCFKLSSAAPDRLIHLLPDELAQAVPDHALFSFAKTADPRDGFVDVSARTFANAINRTSWFLRRVLGEPKSFDTVAYMGPNDIRYFLFMFGAIKVGFKMLFLSPRNNLDGHFNVLEGADCHIFLRASETDIRSIVESRRMKSHVVPELSDFLDPRSIPIYPYYKSFQEARMDPALVLHTTGSTGLPKPITWKVGILSTYEAWRTIPRVGDYVPNTEIYQQSRRAYTSMPLFHTSGLNAGITWSLLLGVTLVYGAPHVVPNSAYVDEMHKYAGVDASMGAPSLYEELSRDPEALERIKSLRYVVASGAPLSQVAGQLISNHTRVISNLGSTETSCLQRLSPSIRDWDYFYWHPTHSGIEMREYMDGLYELFIVRDPNLLLYQGIFINFPNIEEWSMNDLYERHPDPAKSFLYRYKGRKDDVVVLSNGEKIAPTLMEVTLMGSPLVKGAMIIGRGRFQPGALIDLGEAPPNTIELRQQLVQSLLPVINKANEHAPAHGKLDQYHILFTDPNRPVAYLGQGKIQRFRTYQTYEEDIEKLYEAAENFEENAGLAQSNLSHLPKLDFSQKISIIHWLSKLLSALAEIYSLGEHDDIFEAGADSLHIIRMARELRLQAKLAGLTNPSPGELTPKAIYSRPTLGKLAEFLLQDAGRSVVVVDLPSSDVVVEIKSGPNKSIDGKIYESIIEIEEIEIDDSPPNEMQTLFEKYTTNLPRRRLPTARPSTHRMTVLLTGSTGSLGSYLLDTLHHDDNVLHIVCLNRSPNAAEKHRQTGLYRGLSPLSTAKVEYLEADLSRIHFGLEDSVYERLVQTVTHVIHNQWPVNFNWSLPSFEPHVRGVRHLVDFSLESAHDAFIMFISSVSAVDSWDGAGPVPEQAFPKLDMAGKTGYGQSKLIAETMLEKSGRLSGVRSASCRVGIVAGPVEREQGMWNKHEYIPSIIISSVHLGIFPTTFPSRDRIDWLPVDKLSRILLEILVSSCNVSELTGHTAEASQVYHVVNPFTTSWSTTFADSILASYPRDTPLQPVSFEEWVRVLSEHADEMENSDTIDVDRNPAIRLVNFYTEAAESKRGARAFVSHKAMRDSDTLREIGAVNRGWINNWMKQWDISRH
ncbi:acetyl-CoA synthetase-like protein [Jackrogersella minutella]|nr:acetyl-CoA synthetase-like protein [Jackrogersella minutella]